MRSALLLTTLTLCVAASAATPRRAPQTTTSNETTYPAFELNLGAAAGSSGGQSYFEVQVGLNTLFLPWLLWRNAPFYRFRSNQDGVLGLDSSVLGRINVTEGLGLDLGGGYRLTTQSAMNAPFLEARAGVNLPHFSLGLGVKYLLNSLVHTGASDDILYSIGASAGARF